MKERVFYLVRIYLFMVLALILAKPVFMLYNHANHPFTAHEVMQVMSHGITLDLSTALYLIVVPFLVTLLSVWLWRWNGLRQLLKGYYVLVAFLLALAFVADTSLYEFWGFKLDASVLPYLSTPKEAFASVSFWYLLIRILVIVLVAWILYKIMVLLTPVERERRRSIRQIGYSGGRSTQRGLFHISPVKMAGTRLIATVVGLLLIPLFVIGMRGGTSVSTSNVGQVYFSQNQFLNHAAVNPVFSFLSSIGKSGDYIVSYDYMTDEECRQLTDGLYYTDSTGADTLLTTQRPNIVLIVMESCGGQFTEIGGHSEITPRLNQLAHEGISFSECYANSWRTDKGMVSILSGYPSFPVTSIMKVPEKSRKMPSIARSLQQAGYQNTFYYGGDINFTNMRSYVLGTGYDQLLWKSDFSSEEQQTCQWGVRDDIMFDTLLRDIKAEKGSHWMKTLLTLSSHEPWDVPTKVLDDEVYNAFNYLDQCIGRFIDALRQTPAWQNTLVVILPDHGYRYKGIDEATRLYNHIPMLWVGGAVKQPVVIDRLCNQSDLAATLLGQLGISHDDFRFSRDILSSSYTHPVAWHTSTDCLSLYDSTGWMAYDLDAQTMIAQEGSDGQRLLQRARALLQLTSHDLKQK